jgi:chemotaxis protein CheY-P-specific phosphatase CheC
MKSITQATWKDAAVIEARSLLARLEGIAGRASSLSTPPADLVKPTELESVARQAAKLAATIDRIEEKQKRAPRRKAARS